MFAAANTLVVSLTDASTTVDIILSEEHFFQPAHISATNIEWLLQEAVLIQFFSPDDEHDVLETYREL